MGKFVFENEYEKKIDTKMDDLVTFMDLSSKVEEILECYNKDEWEQSIKLLSHLRIPNFGDILNLLRKNKSFESIKLGDATVKCITEMRYKVRNAINRVINIKDEFIDERAKWKEIEYLVKQIYERQKDKLIITEDIKNLKNEGLRISEINFQVKDLVKSITKIELIMMRFKQIDDEIKDTMNYLTDVKDEISRTQTAIQLALDTGEVEKVYWK
jgi:hypothetical protein